MSFLFLLTLVSFSSCCEGDCHSNYVTSENDTAQRQSMLIHDNGDMDVYRSYYKDGGMTYIYLTYMGSSEWAFINITKDSLECEYYKSMIKANQESIILNYRNDEPYEAIPDERFEEKTGVGFEGRE